ASNSPGTPIGIRSPTDEKLRRQPTVRTAGIDERDPDAVRVAPGERASVGGPRRSGQGAALSVIRAERRGRGSGSADCVDLDRGVSPVVLQIRAADQRQLVSLPGKLPLIEVLAVK